MNYGINIKDNHKPCFTIISKKLNIFLNGKWRGLFTKPNKDDQMYMTEIGEHDQKIDNGEH